MGLILAICNVNAALRTHPRFGPSVLSLSSRNRPRWKKRTAAKKDLRRIASVRFSLLLSLIEFLLPGISHPRRPRRLNSNIRTTSSSPFSRRSAPPPTGRCSSRRASDPLPRLPLWPPSEESSTWIGCHNGKKLSEQVRALFYNLLRNLSASQVLITLKTDLA